MAQASADPSRTRPDEGWPWTVYAKIGFAFVVALAVLYPMPSIMLDPDTSHGWIAIFGLMFGAFSLYGSWERFRDVQLVRDTPTSTVRSLAVGAAEVKSEAHAVAEPLVSPLTQQEACSYAVRVEEHRPDKHDDGSDWQTVFFTHESVPFHVDDGTGRVRVEPEEADFEVEREKVFELDDGELPPEEVREWAREHDVGGRHLTSASSYDRKYYERVLAEGESAYVFGGAQRREDGDFAENERNLVMREHRGTERFIVSDKSEGHLLEDEIVETAGVLALALVCLGYGGMGALVSLGLV